MLAKQTVRSSQTLLVGDYIELEQPLQNNVITEVKCSYSEGNKSQAHVQTDTRTHTHLYMCGSMNNI